MKIKLLSFLLLSLILASTGVAPVMAVTLESTTFSGTGTECDPHGPDWLSSIGVECGNLIATHCIDSKTDTLCDLDDAFQTIINFTQILVALTGSVLILMFVYGGTMMIIGGAIKEEYITKGKDAIKAAVIGLVIVLGAWLVINFTILALTKGEVGGETAKIFTRPFNQPPSGAGPGAE